MVHSYKLIPIGEALPGMVLSDDYRDRYGKLLLVKGSVLDEQMLESLRRQEKKLLPVMMIEEASQEEKAASQNKRLQRLEILFRNRDYGEPQDYANHVLRQYMLHFRKGECS